MLRRLGLSQTDLPSRSRERSNRGIVSIKVDTLLWAAIIFSSQDQLGDVPKPCLNAQMQKATIVAQTELNKAPVPYPVDLRHCRPRAPGTASFRSGFGKRCRNAVYDRGRTLREDSREQKWMLQPMVPQLERFGRSAASISPDEPPEQLVSHPE